MHRSLSVGQGMAANAADITTVFSPSMEISSYQKSWGAKLPSRFCIRNTLLS